MSFSSSIFMSESSWISFACQRLGPVKHASVVMLTVRLPMPIWLLDPSVFSVHHLMSSLPLLEISIKALYLPLVSDRARVLLLSRYLWWSGPNLIPRQLLVNLPISFAVSLIVTFVFARISLQNLTNFCFFMSVRAIVMSLEFTTKAKNSLICDGSMQLFSVLM